MKLCINAGNTNITIGVGDKDVVMYEKVRRLDLAGLEETLAQIKQGYEITLCVMASVVPSQDQVLIDLVRKYFDCEFIELTLKDVPFDYSVYETELGLDRALTAFAALSRYPQPFIVFDLGSATSVQVVNYDRLLGGVIMPGLRMGLEALHRKTDLLPFVEDLVVESVVATSTEKNMISGAVFGTIGAIEGVGTRIESQLRSECTWILTGGNTRYIRPHLYHECEINYTLLLEGMLDVVNAREA